MTTHCRSIVIDLTVNGEVSEWAPVESGVPQGAILGPLLFLLYINDITSDICLFADDCIIYRKIAGEDDCFQLQQDLNRLTDWDCKLQMKFNYARCHIMHISQLRSLRYS